MAQASTDPADARLLELLGRPLTDDAEHAEALDLLRQHPAMDAGPRLRHRPGRRGQEAARGARPRSVRTALESFADIVATRSA